MMNRLLLTTSRSATSSLLRTNNHAIATANANAPSSSSISSLRFLSSRYFSDSATSEPPTTTTATNTTTTAENDTNNNNDNDNDDSTSEIKVGTVKYFSFKNSYGFILPDGVDKQNHDSKDLCFIHRNDIRRIDFGKDGAAGDGGNGGVDYLPGLTKNQRVQFKVAPPDKGKDSARAYDLTLEGGNPIPPFQQGYLKSYIRTAKARFGDEVFDIFATSEDQKELEENIVEAYDRVKRVIERQEAKVMRVQEATGLNFEGKEEK
eukprot:CAMPEP_0196130892 /NCGR_PEP_ID=MMETSP0910-20130528/1104_1 /TAXON_ID=49265 /ORGANISM="Thalassiosira rotula, Strain GSO102" /LENGTH=262 /DNA_ID=CAMNT_0041390275 /DNA_START=18 /DNA_END=806 /DNA_ORIENTATION=+